ncbi:UNVERIFIED_CONTAM: hypothetical protein Scaly_2945100 [Sesamum calycinum]|uniref:DUF8040 domain-containing protein n=1 Tax=Sesamum calycinum TaxID=2727403 RepID=A0AAW2KUL4_9LAMI
MTSPNEYFSSPGQAQTSAGPSGSGRRFRRVAGELQAKKCETMDRLNESLQGKIDRTGPKATESIERCVDELTKFTDLPDNVFTTALERFHSHSTRTIFLRLNDENKLRWPKTGYMASSEVNAGIESNSGGESPGTPGTPGSNESDGAGWVAEIMTTPHQGRFFDNIRMTKPCFYALVDALTSRGLLPQGQTSRVTSIEEVALFMQTVGMHKRHRDNMERFQHSLETINRRFHRVLSALCAMAPELITPPNFTEPHPRVANNPDFYPFSRIASERWTGHWYLPGSPEWTNTISIEERPPSTERKYYLVDAGFANYQCFLAPYRGTRFSNDDIIFNEPDEDTLIDMDSFYHRGHPTNSEIEAQRTIRDSIAMQMWADKDPN